MSTKPMKAYAIGCQLKFEATESTPLTTQLGSMKFDVEILDQLAVGRDRGSQIFIVQITNGDTRFVNPDKMVAKCYDPAFCSGQPSCADRKRTESKAYQRLLKHQGVTLPTFYGGYEYSSDAAPQFGRLHAILLQLIEHPTLETLTPQDIARDKLQSTIYAALNEFHSLGVYHRDLRLSNIFWTGSDPIFCDWENATFEDDYPNDTKNWIASDEGCLMSSLTKFGIKDTRPDPPLWFFDFGHGDDGESM